MVPLTCGGGEQIALTCTIPRRYVHIIISYYLFAKQRITGIPTLTTEGYRIVCTKDHSFNMNIKIKQKAPTTR